MTGETISADFPYQSKFVTVNGAKIHYIEEGTGDPVVFLHGIPTSNYLWRNIIPALSDQARCIAPDLIGMGKSDKPDIPYRVFDHIEYIKSFIQTLDLTNITLVLHGWGSVVGFSCAKHFQTKVKALAFYEAHVRPATDWNMLSLPVQQFASLLRDKDASYQAVVEKNIFIDKILPSGIIRKLKDEELKRYREPFSNPASRKPLWQYVQDLPLGDGPDDVVQLISDYSKWLQQSDCPKLMLYAVPGFTTTIDTVQWCKQQLPNLTLIDLGEAMHFEQESHPEKFAEALRDWYMTKVSSCMSENF